jgi:transposase
MSKTCRDWHLDQRRLLPPSVQDLVPEDHLARFVVALVRDELELSAIYAGYAGEKGQPPCHPAMMTALLPYGCAVGVYASRRLARACRERVDFMALVALDAPDFRTISGFRKAASGGASGSVRAGAEAVRAGGAGDCPVGLGSGAPTPL